MKRHAYHLIFALLCPHALHADEATLVEFRAPARIELRDQFDQPRRLAFPTTNIVILAIADRKGSEQIDDWVAAVKTRYAGRVEWYGLADVSNVPRWLRGKVRRETQASQRHPVMMDWSGSVCERFARKRGLANILVLDRDGIIRARFDGPAAEGTIAKLCEALEQAFTQGTNVALHPAPMSSRSAPKHFSQK
jgi:hypothetical protein